MLDKYFLSCLVFTIVKNAVTEISLDYYFGFEDALRTTRYMANCNGNGEGESCQTRCGSNHACLLGKCFCVEMKPQIKEDVIQKLLGESKSRNQKESAEESISKSESEEKNPSNTESGEWSQHPTLRHHIAHFCPTLNKARECVHKCMLLNKPAFCGKDHVCYCGHKYNTDHGNYESEENAYGSFFDLYTKFFGPNPETKENN